MRRGRGDRRGTEGAVYVEFIIAFMPFFTFFLCLWQVSILYSTMIILNHAANVTARAASVVLGDDPTLYNSEAINTFTPERITQIRAAAEIAAAALIVDQTIVDLQVTFPGNTAGGGMPAMSSGSRVQAHMVVQLTAQMNCKISLANAILCKARGTPNAPFSLMLTAQGDYPYMGASYTYN